MATSTPTSISRYKPAVIVIALLSTIYALYYLREQTTASNELPQEQSSSLHRSNAVRRHGSRRRRRSTTAAHSQGSGVEQALIHLRGPGHARRSYGDYTVGWRRSPGDSTSLQTGPNVELNVYNLHNLESLRGPDWPDSLWNELRGQYPRIFLAIFLRIEFRAPLNNQEASALRSAWGNVPDDETYWRQVEDFNEFIRLQNSSESNEDLSPVVQAQAANAQGQVEVDGTGETRSLDAFVQTFEQETVVESDSDASFDAAADRDSLNTSQNMMDLLYHIGGEQARRAYYVHRGVQCNSCGALPIQGIRYHCVNCFDYDLCEACESGQVHIKTHVFLKIRIPGPTRGTVKDVTSPWYPGRPEMTGESLPHWVSRSLLKDTKIDKTELDALYDQFRALAGASYESDSLGIGMAIDRTGFDKYFAVSGKTRHSPPLLVYDRIFAFYDTNNDGLIDFEEFVKGLMNLQDDSRDMRLRRIFRGYDLDDDGFVDRKDFLRMFRSYYAYMKEINREVVAHLEEENTADGLRELLESSQPISAAFTGAIPHGHASRAGAGKERDSNGDPIIVDDIPGALENDPEPHADRSNVIVSAAIGARASLGNSHPFRSFRPRHEQDEPILVNNNVDYEITAITHVDDATEEELEGDDPPVQVYGWPPINTVETSDIVTALGRDVPFDEITDPVDRSRVIHAQAGRLDNHYDRDQRARADKALQDRWRRRKFYVDQEEGMSAPPGYTEDDSSDDEDVSPVLRSGTNSGLLSRRPSMRSRSSSKVRFEDSFMDTEFETRSNTSSRSIPVNERWGGFELNEAEREIGKEILYQTVQQSYNELLDILFKEKESLFLLAKETRAEREIRADEIRTFSEAREAEVNKELQALTAADKLRTEELFATAMQGDARLSPSLALDPETASINSYNAQIESTEDSAAGNDLDETRDPTLPQFRPDHAPPPTLPVASPAGQPTKPRQKLSKIELAKYNLYEVCEIEAKERGGPGKISFEEFAEKMIEDQGDEVGKALGRVEKEEDREGKWPKTAGLGKLQFTGTWLDWASF